MAQPNQGSGALSATTAAQAGLQHIADLTGKEVTGVTSVHPMETGWIVGVEVVEDHRIPSSTDLLALYEAQVAEDGVLLAYQRRKRYPRGRGNDVEGP